jgi:hypothetical protein
MRKPRTLKIGICKRCKRERPIYHIGKQLCGSCRQLERLYNNPKRYAIYLKKQREKYWKNPQKKKDYNYKYYRTGNHGDKMRTYGIKYWREHKEKYAKYSKKWAKEHPERIKERHRLYYQKHKGEKLEQQRKWRKRNPNKTRGYMKKWVNSPKGKKWLEEYNKRPDVIAKRRARTEKRKKLGIVYIKTPEQKAREKAQRDSPKQKKKKHEYDREYTKIKKAKEILNKLQKINYLK